MGSAESSNTLLLATEAVYKVFTLFELWPVSYIYLTIYLLLLWTQVLRIGKKQKALQYLLLSWIWMHSMISLFYMLRLRCSKGCAGQVYERDEILFDQLKYGYFMSCFGGTETE